MKDIDGFISGFKDFQELYFCSDEGLFDHLKKEQNPKAMVIACSDSRVDPAILLGCEPGDIFVLRNVASLVPPYETTPGKHGVSAALEYAVKFLQVEHIIVIGHSTCGGIHALMSPDRNSLGEFIAPWVNIAEQALADVDQKLGHKPKELSQQACEKAAVLISLENLLTFPWIKQRVDAKTLQVHGWYFHMHKGELSRYSFRHKRFEVMVSKCVG